MSIGLSVDYSAHICFGYMVAEGEPGEKALQALKTLGWPVVQGAVSALLGVAALATIDTYIVQTFFKTVFLVIVFGIGHACFFLPVLLTLTDDVCSAIKRCWGAKGGAVDGGKVQNGATKGHGQQIDISMIDTSVKLN